MKKIIKIYLSLLFVLQACTDNRMEGMYEDKVFFIQSGKNEISGFLSDEKMEVDLAVYRSGVEEQSVTVDLVLDEVALENYVNSEGQRYQLLPADCYTISNTQFTFEGGLRSGSAKIVLDIQKIKAIQNALDEKYAIPLAVKSNTINVATNRGQALVIPVLTGGIKAGSTQVLWSKTFTDMGIASADHFTASLAVTDEYLFVNTRNADLKYYNRMTGEFKGAIVLPFKGSLTNFTVANDEGNNLLITNLRNAATGMARQTIYKISGTGAPEVFINIDHEYPNGRKLSITGNLETNAIITSTVENSSKVLYWEVKNGVLVSQRPTLITLDATKINWRNFADAIPKSLDIKDGMFVVGNGAISAFGYFQATGMMLGAINLTQLGFPIENANTFQSLAEITFNGARYLAFANQSGPSQMYAGLWDVTKVGLITSNNSLSLLKYKSQPLTTTNNVNFTADVQVRLAVDKKSFVMYALGTNGGVVATQFSD